MYSEDALHRWSGRFGNELSVFLESIKTEENELIPNTTAYWAEMRWAAKNEGVVHLDDLLLRRVRLGLVLPEGGLQYAEKIRKINMQQIIGIGIPKKAPVPSFSKKRLAASRSIQART
jgi:glycerol-3-phosphate dehydrogenase